MFRKRLSISHASVPGLAAGLLAAAGAALGISPSVKATLLVSEGFNYSNVANGASMNGVAATGLGLTGNYAVTNLNSANKTAAFNYSTSQLKLGNLAVSPGGGSVVYDNGTTPYYGQLSLTAAISGISTSLVSANTFSLYGSYLVELNKPAGYNQVTEEFIGRSGATDNTYVTVSSQAYANNSLGNIAANGGYHNAVASLTGSPLSANTPYLVLFQISASPSSDPTVADASISEWILNAAQYNNFAGSGTLDATDLNAAANGTGNNQTIQSGTYIGQLATAGIDSSYWGLNAYGAGYNIGQLMNFGEYRLSDTSLAQAAPLAAVPEPASLALFALGGLALLAMSRKRLTRRVV